MRRSVRALASQLYRLKLGSHMILNGKQSETKWRLAWCNNLLCQRVAVRNKHKQKGLASQDERGDEVKAASPFFSENWR